MRRKNPTTKSAKKFGGPKIKIREKSILPRSDPNYSRRIYTLFSPISVHQRARGEGGGGGVVGLGALFSGRQEGWSRLEGTVGDWRPDLVNKSTEKNKKLTPLNFQFLTYKKRGHLWEEWCKCSRVASKSYVWFANSLASYRSLSGPSGPKCPGKCPRECPRKRGVSDRVSEGASRGPGLRRHPVGHSISIAARGAEQEGRNPAQGSRGFGAP